VQLGQFIMPFGIVQQQTRLISDLGVALIIVESQISLME
jgi:hypothetical protein